MSNSAFEEHQAPSIPALSFFTGAGGLDLGVREAGFNPTLSIEADQFARLTLAANWPDHTLAEPGDVHALSLGQIEEQSGLKRGDVGLLFGGPPCQPFSKAALWHAGKVPRLKDPRAKTLTAMLDAVAHFLPDAVLIENVSGLATGRGSGASYINRVFAAINRAHGTKYRPTMFVLNALDYGVPQARERLFIVAARSGQRITPPGPSYFDPDLAGDEHPRWRTCWDAIGHLAVASEELKCLQPRGKWAELLPSIPEGHNYLWHTDRGGGHPIFGWRRRYWSFLLKLAKNKPSWTVAASPGPATGPFHWENRRLSVAELAALQTFPADYHWPVAYRLAQGQIGNAVPPALAAAVAVSLRAQCFDGLLFDASRFVPKESPNCPEPEPPQTITDPLKMTSLDNTPHPGEGKGPGVKTKRKALESVSTT
ncbi:DNA cytosine methyltransferase [Stutzerimonas nitrititolerans]|uniref:DNA cytosine methyltransferase n=1 Tax=Stutzerimonas nitrititolerans TaxID=2482751 RepID=UPI0028A5A0B9|nr:DNA cytosine methyltransferase [Stutzerimonas nitrititolerans]